MPKTEKKDSGKQNLVQIATLILAVVISAIIFIFREKLSLLSTFGYLGLFLFSILGNATIIFPVPAILAAFLGGGIFDPFLVGIITAFGATIGELTGYLAGLGGRVVIKDKEKFGKIENWMKKYGIATIFVLAIIPNPLFDVAGIASGMLKLPVWKFFLAAWLGKTIKFLGFSYLGAGSFSFFGKFG